MFADLAEGFRYIRASRLMVGTLIVTMLMNLFAFPYMSQQPIIAREVLAVGDVLGGLLNSVEGVGSLLGAILIATYALPRHYSRINLYGSLLFLGGILLFSQSSSYWISFVIVFVGGFGMSAFGTMQSTIMVSLAYKGIFMNKTRTKTKSIKQGLPEGWDILTPTGAAQ